MSTATLNPITSVPGVSTSVSVLMGAKVTDAQGKDCGRVREFVVNVAQEQTRVQALVLTRRANGKTEKLLLPVDAVEFPMPGQVELRAKSAPERFKASADYLLLDYDLLDQQIIDVDGRKVVRVNDVNLTWEPGEHAGQTAGLRIDEVEVGTRGASRRLLKGLPVAAVEGVAGLFEARVIPWNCVDLIERDPARRVKLKIGQDRLAKLHPSDIAEILEELAPAERDAVFASLDEETAAETLEEVEPKLQKALLEGMDSEKAADIVEEMDPGAAADLLAELSDEESDAILEEMEPEERQEVEELLEFAANSAAGLMTTDFVSVLKDASAAEAVTALREFEGDPDTVTEIYLYSDNGHFAGVVTLPKLLLAPPEARMASLTDGHKVSCGLHDSAKYVAELFDKYNLRSLAVLDAQKGIAGAIHAEQVIGHLLEQ
jgi:sporulation protein YlmC with PRC-barrel domain/CBS domain-containing protein